MSNKWPIFESSSKINEDRRTNVKRNFPWNIINCGQSFAVPLNEIKIQTLRSQCSVMGKKLHKKFKVVIHNDCYEVARID